MAIVKTSGTQTATLGTEHVLATVTDAGTYDLEVDAKNLVDGETLELRVYSKVLPAGAEGVAFFASFENAQGSVIKVSPPKISPHYVKYTLKQTGGTGRSFDWAVYQADADA